MEDKSTKYIETVGRRKTSVARVRITPATKTTFLVNEKELEKYFPTKEMQNIVIQMCNRRRAQTVGLRPVCVV